MGFYEFHIVRKIIVKLLLSKIKVFQLVLKKFISYPLGLIQEKFKLMENKDKAI